MKKIFPQRKHNAQMVLQMSSAKYCSIRLFQSYADSYREHKNITCPNYFVIIIIMTSEFGMYNMKKRCYRLSIVINVDVHIFLINKNNPATYTNIT